jgi:hypothetical protein
MIPFWLTILSWLALAVGLVSAGIAAAAVIREPPRMAVMRLVWPLVALFSGPVALWGFRRFGRGAGDGEKQGDIPYWAIVGKAASHCGAGCTLGDIIAETLAVTVPAIIVPFGWPWLFSERVFATWGLDFVLAFALGIGFQYFTIAPMRKLPPGQGLVAALKADTLSLIAWQVGMYGFMAFAGFFIFRTVLGVKLEATMPEFWFMMQIAMLCGFATSYPVNWWLVSSGLKEKM